MRRLTRILANLDTPEKMDQAKELLGVVSKSGRILGFGQARELLEEMMLDGHAQGFERRGMVLLQVLDLPEQPIPAESETLPPVAPAPPQPAAPESPHPTPQPVAPEAPHSTPEAPAMAPVSADAPKCGGTGLIDGQLCSTCNGLGLVGNQTCGG